MKRIKKPDYNVKIIIYNCANSITDPSKRKRIIDAADRIATKSSEYDHLAESRLLYTLELNDLADSGVTKDDMIGLYDNKFVKHKDVRPKYYDKIKVSTNGICPICGIGQVQNLDHYLPKSLYPIYAVTPYNLIPICRDCNFDKSNQSFSDENKAPIHPYYDDIENTIWLKAELLIQNGGLVTHYCVDNDLEAFNNILFYRCLNHMNTYNLYNRYSIQAAREIADNEWIWKKNIDLWGEDMFKEYINDQIKSFEYVDKNTWKIALYRALINNIELLR